jgi:hypothetical protein
MLLKRSFVYQIRQVQIACAQADPALPNVSDQIGLFRFIRETQKVLDLPPVFALPAEKALFLSFPPVDPAQDKERLTQKIRVLTADQFLPGRISDIRMGMMKHIDMPLFPQRFHGVILPFAFMTR